MTRVTRRDFLRTCSATAVVAATFQGGARTLQAHAISETVPEIAVFTKSFQDWSIREVCQKFQQLGVTGLDLTVRPGGHIAPADITRKLPEAHAIAQEEGLKIVQITSGVTEPDEYGKTLFETAGKLGIRKIKLGYYRGRQFGQLAEELKQTQRQLAALIPVAKDAGVLPCVHIHSGNYIPSHGTMLYQLLQDFDPQEIGAYVDMLHMSLEGGSGGWKQGLDLLAPWIQLCAVKNYRVIPQKRDAAGQQRWRWETAPVADGISPIPDFVNALQKLNYRGPYSLHSEYHPALNTEECYTQTAEDLKFFRALFS